MRTFETRTPWDQYFFDILEVVAAKSKDASSKVGCVIVGKHHEIVSTGYNGFPMGVWEHDSRNQRPTKYFYTEHCERNAIYLAARRGIAIEGCTIYLKWMCCADCARAIIQSGITEVKIDGSQYNPNTPTEKDLRWKDSFDAAESMLHESGIPVRILEK